MVDPIDTPPDHEMPDSQRMSRWHWSPELDAALIEGYRLGKTLARLSAELARPSWAIDHRVRTLRDSGVELPVRKPRWTADAKRHLADRYRAGASRNELAAEFGKAKGTINRQLASLARDGVDLSRHQTSTKRRGPSRPRIE